MPVEHLRAGDYSLLSLTTTIHSLELTRYLLLRLIFLWFGRKSNLDKPRKVLISDINVLWKWPWNFSTQIMGRSHTDISWDLFLAATSRFWLSFSHFYFLEFFFFEIITQFKTLFFFFLQMYLIYLTSIMTFVPLFWPTFNFELFWPHLQNKIWTLLPPSSDLY